MKTQIIKKYIMRKILNQEWKINEKISSERELAIKFSFSRWTIRMALSAMVKNGWLSTHPRKGYIVDGDGHLSVLSFATKHKITRTTISKKLTKFETFLLSHLTKTDINNQDVFVKKYYRSKVLIAISVNIINKDYTFSIGHKKFEQGFIKTLQHYGVNVKEFKRKTNIIKGSFNKLGYKDVIPIMEIKLLGNEATLEHSIMIVCANDFEINEKIIF